MGERLPIEAVQDLVRVGEVLPLPVYDLHQRLLLNEGQLLSSQRQWELLLERSAWVEGALAQALRAQHAQSAQAAAEPLPGARRAPTLFDGWEHALWDLDALLRGTAKGKAGAADWQAEIANFMQLVGRDPDVALFLAMRQEDRRFALYALAHSLHSAVLCLLGAQQAGWSVERQASVVGAALSMNVAMLELQANMAEQSTPPTRQQLQHIRAHPELGVQMLRASAIDDAAWLQAVAEHHERADGSGYPQGAETVCDEARLLRMADVYMAKITPRANRPPLAPLLASRQLFLQEPGSALAVALIKSIGAHPPGSLVLLKSGEVAVVTRRSLQGRGPKVGTLSDNRGRPRVGTRLLDSADAGHAITGPCLDVAAYPRVLPERVYGLIPP